MKSEFKTCDKKHYYCHQTRFHIVKPDVENEKFLVFRNKKIIDDETQAEALKEFNVVDSFEGAIEFAENQEPPKDLRNQYFKRYDSISNGDTDPCHWHKRIKMKVRDADGNFITKQIGIPWSFNLHLNEDGKEESYHDEEYMLKSFKKLLNEIYEQVEFDIKNGQYLVEEISEIILI